MTAPPPPHVVALLDGVEAQWQTVREELFDGLFDPAEIERSRELEERDGRP